MELLETMEQAANGIISSLKQHLTNFYVLPFPETVVLKGRNGTPNYEYIKEHNMKVFELQTAGGNIVLHKGDVGIAIVGEYQYVHDRANEFLNNFKLFLESKGLVVSKDNNDVLANGYKVCSFSANYIKQYDWTFFTFGFSINVDLNLIKNICNKPMVKIPKGLSEFGITQEQVLVWLENWLSENFKEGEEV